jgi:hypothetical protein
MASLLDMAQARLQGLLDIPARAGRALVDPTVFSGLLGAPTLPKERGIAQAAYGLPPEPNMSVLNPEQAAYMQGYAQGEPLSYLGLLAPFTAPAAVAGAKAVAPQAGMALENYMARQGLLQPLTAYHGTPHTIQGKFDINKVGTGEGAQAYGHGMYFAENPAVAKQYAMTTPKNIDNEAYNAENIANRLFKGGYDEQYITNRIKDVLPNANEEIIANAVESAKKGKVGGNIYKVDIPDAYIPKMIDSDKQLKDQSTIIKEFVKKNIDELTADMHEYKPQSKNDKVWDRLRGIDLLMWANEKYGKENAAKFLNAEGIKGVRYLDEGSRSAGKGTSNFVVFDPADVKILEKNSKKVEGLLD